MTRGAKYEIVITHDPEGLFRGARIPFREFLFGLAEGVYPKGMKVSKRAVTSEFVVGESETGLPILLDEEHNPWYPRKKGEWQLFNGSLSHKWRKRHSQCKV